jgi:alkylation response protein AidB-like acyl-CoA dehydrogenase
MNHPEEYGGAGPIIGDIIVLEEFARACITTAFTL